MARLDLDLGSLGVAVPGPAAIPPLPLINFCYASPQIREADFGILELATEET